MLQALRFALRLGPRRIFFIVVTKMIEYSILAPEDETVFNEGCSFPQWAVQMGPMKSMTYTSHYEYSPGK